MNFSEICVLSFISYSSFHMSEAQNIKNSRILVFNFARM
jgi:hypothetical protein